MTRSRGGALLLLTSLVALVCARPAASQFLFLDTNHDAICDARDALTPGVTSVDVYLVTDRNADGSPITCSQEAAEFNLFSYEFILRASGEGAVAFGAWIQAPALSEFTVAAGLDHDATDFHVGFGTIDPLPPGRYRLGTLGVTVTGSPQLSFVTSSGMSRDYVTAFGSACPGSDFDNTLKLGSDFTDACGTAPPAARPASAWDSIRKIYR